MTQADQGLAVGEGGQAQPLSARELEVVALVAEGLSNPAIGRRLAISRHTVKAHLVNIFNKFGVCHRTGAALAAARRGLI